MKMILVEMNMLRFTLFTHTHTHTHAHARTHTHTHVHAQRIHTSPNTHIHSLSLSLSPPPPPPPPHTHTLQHKQLRDDENKYEHRHYLLEYAFTSGGVWVIAGVAAECEVAVAIAAGGRSGTFVQKQVAILAACQRDQRYFNLPINRLIQTNI